MNAARTKVERGTKVSRDCPKCGTGSKLMVRTNRANGSQFLGCPNWPTCNYTEPIPESVMMELAGAQRMPGF